MLESISGHFKALELDLSEKKVYFAVQVYCISFVQMWCSMTTLRTTFYPVCLILLKLCVVSSLMRLLEMSDKLFQLWDIFRVSIL